MNVPMDAVESNVAPRQMTHLDQHAAEGRVMSSHVEPTFSGSLAAESDRDEIGGSSSWEDDPLFRSLNQEEKLSVVEKESTTRTRCCAAFTPRSGGDKQSSSSSSNNKGKKKVRFVPSEQGLSTIACYLPTLEELPVSVRRACWWREDDFYFFKKAARRVCRDVQLVNGVVLQNFEHAGYGDAKYLALTLEEYEVETLLASTTVQSKAVTAWCQEQSNLRGLEHWTSRKHAGCRHEAMQECLQVVVELSDFHETPQEIAKQSREYSRASRILARWFGQADAAAAEEEDPLPVVVVSAGKAADSSLRTHQQDGTSKSSRSRKNNISSNDSKSSRSTRRRGSAKHNGSNTTPSSPSAPPPPPSSSPFANLPLLSRRRRSANGAEMPSRKLGLRHKIFR